MGFFCEQNCKPGSVFDSHLSRRAVANALQPPRERPGRPICSHTGVAPDRVYSIGHFRADGCALTAPFHPYRRGRAVPARGNFCEIASAAAGRLERKAGLRPTFKLSPVPCGPLARTPQERPCHHGSTAPAVYLCCTFPEVAFGGRYPLFLPCGARTFLMAALSPPPRGRLFYSPCYSTKVPLRCQQPLLLFRFSAIILCQEFYDPGERAVWTLQRI